MFVKSKFKYFKIFKILIFLIWAKNLVKINHPILLNYLYYILQHDKKYFNYELFSLPSINII